MMENDTFTNAESDNNSSSSLPLYYIILASLLAFVAVVGNGIVIYLICTRRRLHVVTNYFVVSLAAADFLVGLFLPTFIIACDFWSDCQITTYNMFFNLFTLTSIANLFVMTVDRYISIVHPLRYQSYATSSRLFGAMLASWIIPGLLSFSPLFWKFSSLEKVSKDTATKVHAFIVITAFEVVPTVVMPAMYAHIFRTARKHARQVAVQITQLEFNSTCSQQVFNEKTNTLQITTPTGKRISNASQQSKGERRSDGSGVAVLGAVIGLFVLCWSFDTVLSFCTKLELCIISDGLYRVSDLFIFVNSAINPLVYALLKKDIKRELSVMCCCTQRDNDWKVHLLFMRFFCYIFRCNQLFSYSDTCHENHQSNSWQTHHHILKSQCLLFWLFRLPVLRD